MGSRASNCRYGFKSDGESNTQCFYDWSTVEWNTECSRIMSPKQATDKINKVSPYLHMTKEAVEFKISRGQWPKAKTKACKNGIPESCVDQIIEVFKQEFLAEQVPTSAGIALPKLCRNTEFASDVTVIDTLKDGLTTCESSSFLRRSFSIFFKDYQIREACQHELLPCQQRNKPGYSTPIYIIHPRHLENLAATYLKLCDEKKISSNSVDQKQTRLNFDAEERNLLKRCEELIRAATEETDKAVGEAHDSIVLNVREMILPLRNAQKKDRASLERVLYLVTNLYHLLDVPVPETTKEDNDEE